MAQDRVEAVERALSILEAFDTAQERLSLAELATATGYYKSTLLRLLGSLERFDYVQRDGDGRYRLGHTPVRLARRHPPSRQLASRIQPILDNLAVTSGETAALIAVNGEIVECRLVALPNVTLRHDLHPGLRWNISTNASPALDFAGGKMVCRPLLPAHDEHGLWLSLSGPSGRLDPQQASTQLDNALNELAHRPINEY